MFINLFINRLLGVLLKDCYDSSSALGCGQQSAQSRGVTGRSLGVARSSLRPGLGCACAVEARRAVEASSEAAQWPVSVPGGQSW